MNLAIFYPMVYPLLGGILIGLASWLLLASLGRVAGISSITAEAIAPSQADKNNASDRSWRWVFLGGLVLGGFVANAFIQTPTHSTRPLWLLIAAGLLVGYGTVLGSGCTSGHGVCGLGRRSMRSLVATCTFMAAGVATVFVVNALTGRAMI